MPVVYFVRHGQASFGAADYDVLSELGREQAAATGVELARRGPRDPVIVSGSLKRQRETAQIIAKAGGFDGERREDPRWNEYDPDLIVGRYSAESADFHGRDTQRILDGALRGWISDGEPADVAGETWAEFAGRTRAAMAEIPAGLGAGRDVVVVSSGGVLAAVAGGLLQVPAAGVVSLNRVAVNAAITTFSIGRSGTNLLSYNDHAHLLADRRLLTYR